MNRTQTQILLATLGCLFVLGVGAGLRTFRATSTTSSESASALPKELGETANPESLPLAPGPSQVERGQADPWSRPNAGQPVALKYLPKGVQTVIQVRLAQLLAHPEGTRALRSLGPGTSELLQRFLHRIGLAESNCESLTLALLPNQGRPRVVVIADLTPNASRRELRAYGAANGRGEAKLGDQWAWFPAQDARAIVVGATADLAEIRARESSSAGFRLSRTWRKLLEHTHDTDDVTILANPHFFRDEAQPWVPGPRGVLLSGLNQLLSDDAQSILFAIQLGQAVVAELRIVTRAEMLPGRLAEQLRRQLELVPSKVGDYLGTVALDPYWQRLALRFPAMVEFVVDHTRVHVEDRQVVVSSAAPAAALHNLLLASELTLASPTSSAGAFTTPNEKVAPSTLAELLAHRFSISFAQHSLDDAVREIESEVRAQVETPPGFALGLQTNALQRGGITLNQQIRDFNATDQTLIEILNLLVSRANPSAPVSGLADPAQKLIWVPHDQGLLITTRRAAEDAGQELPDVFRE